jgi:7-cyano-7-deazaguanine synthase
MSKVLLSSGGMDSFLLAMEPEVRGAKHVFVDIGQAYVDKELRSAANVAEAAGAELIYMSGARFAQYEHKPTGIIPFRNAELLLCAAQHGDTIYFGVIGDEVNSDKSPQFVAAMEGVLRISHRKQYWTFGRDFDILTPFRGLSKTELVKRYLERGGDLHKLTQTVSCYDGGDMHCGQCSSCFKRWVALTTATGQDAASLHPWVKHPGYWHTREYWAEKLDQPDYQRRRYTETMQALDIARL